MNFFSKRVNDPRLSKTPKVRLRGEFYFIRIRFLTPLRVAVMTKGVFELVQTLWIGMGCLLLFDAIVMLVAFPPQILVQTYLPERLPLYAVMVALPILKWLEQTFGYPISRFFIGRSVSIAITPCSVWVSRRFWIARRFDRSQSIRFAAQRFEQTQNPIYQNALRLSVSVDDSVRIGLGEIYDPTLAEALIGNANFILAQSEDGFSDEFDVDPTATYA